ncbi:alpha/beta hydrolase [Thalassolituus oleivorans]|jgi:acetyl esterase/lipase|uniref:alpha/beta hydrolase n=1 Tax=Thalassolituus oleivorans TaxID=187493 RepID=UPI00042DBD07|nr:alpha/beta hydrolase [Thalassolituus oleivorans]AHK16322.1 esterase [Thalassolituus oleivorans R6-15]APR67710.1 thioesterase [Thalassolituus oleivorans]MBQ0726629.1 alpha/beta hydrolase [Thalassolituus oleivorans]MBQ0780191.1 alpha/beta hydrolase [Thalassolituus oleivorans]MCA6127243.1 thioesterase [Thalassolituus oleivorans 4BN06-13]
MRFKQLIVIPVLTVLTACSPQGIVNGISKVYSADVVRDLPYGQLERQKYDLYLPSGNESDSPTPVIVFFYGGSWNSGEKSGYEFVARRLTAQGYIVAVPNYRLYPEVTYPDFLVDCAAAVKVIHDELQSAKYRALNPEQKLILMGHSAGAYNAAMLAMDDRWLSAEGLDRMDSLRGWVGLAGPYDLYPIVLEDVKPVFFYPNYPPNSNPIEFVESSDLPALILAPENDELISTERHSYSFSKALDKLNKPHTLVTVKGTGHTSLIGAFSPVLFFKGSTIEPINTFIKEIERN